MKRLPSAALTTGLLIAVLVAQERPPSGSPPPMTFRAQVNYVEVDALVTDQRGRVVTDLTQNDFEIRENGAPQTIATFSLIDIPIRTRSRAPTAPPPIERDVQSNEQVDGRIYLLVLDDLHTRATNGLRVKAALRRFIEQDFGANDLAAVVFTGARSVDAQDFTGNRRLLLAAIDRFTPQKLPSATLGRIQGSRSGGARGHGTVGPGVEPDAEERAYRARVAMATVRRLVESLADVRGRRKALLLVSEGPDYDLDEIVGAPNAAVSVLDATRVTIAAATRGNVHIYALDPRGLQPDGEELIEVSSDPDTPGGDAFGLQSLRNERATSQGTLRDLALSTGGFAAINTNDFNGAFSRIVRENSTYYLLGYYPTNDARDGKVRAIDVRVTRPGLTVRSRKEYTAPASNAPAAAPTRRGGFSPAVSAALSSPLPVAGVPIRVFAAAFKDTGRDAAIPIAIDIDASNFTFAQQNDTYRDQVDVEYAITGATTKSYTARRTVNVVLRTDAYQRTRASGIRVIAQANLPPGRYQLRVAAGDASGKAGSVISDLEVPDFSKAPLSLSGVALTSQAAERTITSRPSTSNDWLKEFLPGLSTKRDFDASDVVAIFGEVYRNLDESGHVIDIKTELHDQDGRIVRTLGQQSLAPETRGKNRGYGFGARLVLDGLAPGGYVIHVEAQSQGSSNSVIARDIPIRVR